MNVPSSPGTSAPNKQPHVDIVPISVPESQKLPARAADIQVDKDDRILREPNSTKVPFLPGKDGVETNDDQNQVDTKIDDVDHRSPKHDEANEDDMIQQPTDISEITPNIDDTLDATRDEETEQIYKQIPDDKRLSNNLDSDLAPLVNHLKNKKDEELMEEIKQ